MLIIQYTFKVMEIWSKEALGQYLPQFHHHSKYEVK